MTLKEWLAKKDMSDAEFARVSGIGQRALVQKYRHGRQFPALENLRRITDATRGAVTAADFVDEQAPAGRPLPAPTRPRAPKRKAPAPTARSTAPKASLAAAEP